MGLMSSAGIGIELTQRLPKQKVMMTTMTKRIETMSIKTVAVLGAGTMGNGIAHVFARAGYKVILRDVEQRFLDRGLETIGKNLDREIKKGKLAEAEKGTVLARLKPVTDMRGIAAADLWWRRCRKKWRSSARCSPKRTASCGRKSSSRAILHPFR